MTQVTLTIEGMSCGHCLNAVRQALGNTRGVEIEAVELGRATVRYDEAVTSPEKIVAAVEQAGYQASA